jgi:hypothetical protein
MERRKFLIGTGSLAAGAAAITGSGAFTWVKASRDITIEVRGDSAALLGLEPSSSPNGDYAEATGDPDTIELDFTDDSSTGLNNNADTNIEDVVKVTNNGTQDVYVNVGVVDEAGNTGQDVAGLQEFGISGDSGGRDFARLDAAYNGDSLPVGGSAGLGFYFFLDENGDDVIDDIDTLVIVAAESESEMDDIAADF